mmetsp:Transcript_32324/g.93100  ORF Transcript_32324/g.93100 Transcript_32324/m.93100 type:complete len:200 (-) Transcript_32324:929-1528(-)
MACCGYAGTSFNIGSDLGDRLTVLDLGARGGGRRRLREDHGDGLLAISLLNCPHLDGTGPVDTEPGSILGDLVEYEPGGPEGLARGLVVWPSLQGTLELCRVIAVRDFKARGPRGWEERARVSCRECCAEEVLAALLQDGVLGADQAAELLDVAGRGVGGREELALLLPVREGRVEDAPEQFPVFLLEGGLCAIALSNL